MPTVTPESVTTSSTWVSGNTVGSKVTITVQIANPIPCHSSRFPRSSSRQPRRVSFCTDAGHSAVKCSQLQLRPPRSTADHRSRFAKHSPSRRAIPEHCAYADESRRYARVSFRARGVPRGKDHLKQRCRLHTPCQTCGRRRMDAATSLCQQLVPCCREAPHALNCGLRDARRRTDYGPSRPV